MLKIVLLDAPISNQTEIYSCVFHHNGIVPFVTITFCIVVAHKHQKSFPIVKSSGTYSNSIQGVERGNGLYTVLARFSL